MKQEKNKEFENEQIPSENRKSIWTMIIVMAGFSIFSATIWVGADIANSFELKNLIWIILAGNILLTIYISLLAFIGGETGLSTHSLSKRIFGKHGYKITSMIAMITQLGWFGVGLMMFVGPVSKLLGIDDQKWLVFIILIFVGILMISTAFIGIRALTWVSAIAVPLVVIFGFVMIGLCVSGYGDATWNPVPNSDDPYTSMQAIGLVFATFVSGGTLTPDFVRWAKNGKQAVISVVLSFLVFSSLMLLFGAFAFYGTGESDLSDALIVMGLAVPGVLVLGANIWTTNDNGLYTQGLAASLIFNVPKKYAIIVLGGIGIVLAPVFNLYFVPFLDILNLLIPGIGTLIIINELIFKDDYSEKNVNIYSLLSWGLGIIIAIVFQLFVIEFIIPLYTIMFTIIFYLSFYFGDKVIRNVYKKDVS